MNSPDYQHCTDADLVRSVVRREPGAFRFVMARCNQRLFRAARSVVGTDHEAEDIVQESWVIAYEKLDGFRGECALLTWLTQIVVNEARQRLRDRKHNVDLSQLDAPGPSSQVVSFPSRLVFGSDPVSSVAHAEIRRFLEKAIDDLPVAFRTVYVLREIEECSVEETAAALSLRPETVKTRLHRARRLLRDHLESQVHSSMRDAFQFLGTRCARITDRVHVRIALATTASPGGAPPQLP